MSIESFDLSNGYTRENLFSLSFSKLCTLANMAVTEAKKLGLSKDNLIEFVLSTNL